MEELDPPTIQVAPAEHVFVCLTCNCDKMIVDCILKIYWKQYKKIYPILAYLKSIFTYQSKSSTQLLRTRELKRGAIVHVLIEGHQLLENNDR